MDEQTFKKLLKEEIRPIKDIVEVMKKKVDSHDLYLSTIAHNVRDMKEQQSIMNEKLDNHTASLMEIESTLDSYADSYKENQKNIERVDIRLGEAEKKLDITPSEDLKIPHFQISS